MQSSAANSPLRVGDPDEAERLALVGRGTRRNPAPAPKYDLVVIGGGTAGLVCAMGAAGLGARVALVERHLLGGDCLNTGCVPSKALIGSSRAVAGVRRAVGFGIDAAATVNFPAVMRRLRNRRAVIAASDSVGRLTRAGVDVFFGEGRFVSRKAIAVGDAVLPFGRAVVATGGRALVPPIPGFEAVPYFTNESIFEIDTLPNRLLVIGAGPIGCELAQAFARLGASVTVVDQAEQPLPRESADASLIVRRRMEADGVRFVLGASIERAEFSRGEVGLIIGRTALAGDAVLVAAGRVPNVESLGLDAAGVRTDRRGVVVNDRLQTTNSRVFASGDVCSDFKFTHAADALSRIVVQNALFFGRKKASALVIPWVTFTDPEVAQVGVSSRDVAASGGRLATVAVEFSDVDRAVVDDETDGFVQVHHEGGRIRGCTIVGRHAGEMIGEAAVALTHGHTLADLSAVVHPYPTLGEAFRKAGDAYRRGALTPRVKRWLARYFDWTR